MEETLYCIEIYKDGSGYRGKIFSDVDGVREFRNVQLDQLLKDIIFDLQLALGEIF